MKFYGIVSALSVNSIDVVSEKGDTITVRLDDPWLQFIPFLRIQDEVYVEFPKDVPTIGSDGFLTIEPRYLVSVTETLDAITCPRKTYVKSSGADAHFDRILNKKMVRGNLLHDLFSDRIIHRSDLPDGIKHVIEQNEVELILSDYPKEEAEIYLQEDGLPLRGISIQGKSEVDIRHYGYGLTGRLDGYIDKPMILELKSGNLPGATPRPDHNIQMNIYQDLVSDYHNSDSRVPGKVIYISGGNMAMLDTTKWSHLDTVVARNYVYLVKSGRYAPQILRGEAMKACRNCYVSEGCYQLCAGLIQQRDCDVCFHDSSCHKQEWKPEHRQFFKDLKMATVAEENEGKKEEYAGLRSRRYAASPHISAIKLGEDVNQAHLFETEFSHESANSNFRRGDFVMIYPHDQPSHFAEMTYSGILVDITGDRLLVRSANSLPEAVDIYPSSITALMQRSREIIYKSVFSYGRTDGRGSITDVFLNALTDPTMIFSDFQTTSTLTKPLMNYNDRQYESIIQALDTPDFFLIQGPAGTGKTSVVIELVHQLHQLKKSVLISAYTNMAVDNVALKLMNHNIPFIRLGNMESSPPVLYQYGVVHHAKEFRNFVNGDSPIIILATTSTIGRKNYDHLYFDYVLLDEAAQQTLPHSFMPVYHGKKAILVGDHAQLPAIVTSTEAQNMGLGKSLFEQLVRFENRFIMLNEQYRMSDEILSLPNDLFYGGELISATKQIANQKLEVAGKLLSDNSYQVIAIEPDDFHIGQNNYFEAHLIVHIIAELLDGGIEMERIGIIAPFRAQVALLRELLPGVLIDTIDRFQGSESDVIILSTTTSAHVPLLTDERRINVALTRAREKMIVVQTNPSRIRQSSLMRTIYRDGFRRGVLTEIGDKEIREYSNEVSSVLERLGLAGVFSPIPQGEVFFGDILLYYGSIPIVIVTLQEEDRCHICYRFTTTGMQCPGCGYLFHEDHLLNWVEQNASCPTCRHRLEIVRL